MLTSLVNWAIKPRFLGGMFSPWTRTLFVDPSGTRGDHTTVNDAFAAAVDGGASDASRWRVVLGQWLYSPGNGMAGGAGAADLHIPSFLDVWGSGRLTGFDGVRLHMHGRAHARHMNVRSGSDVAVVFVCDDPGGNFPSLEDVVVNMISSTNASTACVRMTGEPFGLAFLKNCLLYNSNNAGPAFQSIIAHLAPGTTGAMELYNCHFKTSSNNLAEAVLALNEGSTGNGVINLSGDWACVYSPEAVMMDNQNPDHTDGGSPDVSVSPQNTIGNSFRLVFRGSQLKEIPYRAMRGVSVTDELLVRGASLFGRPALSAAGNFLSPYASADLSAVQSLPVGVTRAGVLLENERPVTLNRLRAEITNGAAGAVWRLRVHGEQDGRPGGLLLDATIDASVNGTRSLTVNLPLPAGRTWITVTGEGTAAATGRAIKGHVPWLPQDVGVTAAAVGCTGTYAGNVFTPATYISQVPMIQARVA